jgi:hypothetical protein
MIRAATVGKGRDHEGSRFETDSASIFTGIDRPNLFVIIYMPIVCAIVKRGNNVLLHRMTDALYGIHLFTETSFRNPDHECSSCMVQVGSAHPRCSYSLQERVSDRTTSIPLP